MYNAKKMKKLIKELMILLGEMNEKLDDNSYTADDCVMEMIENRADQIFNCDILSTSDIIAGITKVNPTIGEKLNSVSLGKMFARIGKYTKVRALDDTKTHRLWVIRDFQDYKGLKATVIWDTYEEQFNPVRFY